MYKEHLPQLKRLQLAADLLLVGAASAVAPMVVAALWPDRSPASPDELLWVAPMLGLLWLFFLDANGLYYTYRTTRGRDLAGRVARSIVQGTAVTGAVLFLLEAEGSRLLLVLFATTSFAFLLAERLLLLAILAKVREQGWNFNSIVIVGTGSTGRHVLRALRRHPAWGIRPFGFLSADPSELAATVDGLEVVGTVDDLERVLAANPVDEVAIALPEISSARLGAMVAACEREGAKARVVSDLYGPATARVVHEDLEGLPMVTFAIGPGAGWQLLCKEGLDRLVAVVLLVLLAPLLLVIVVAVRLDSPGSALFVQERMGLRKRRFRLYKFRTMEVGAEARREALEPFNEAPAPAFKMASDPRVTRVGRWLRRLSLDELPQLWNVLRGEMSLIGPRPSLPEEVARYEDWQRRRFRMKPGLSGLWQVSARGRGSDFGEWVRLDLEYIDNWSLGLDLRIFLKTIPIVFTGRGTG